MTGKIEIYYAYGWILDKINVHGYIVEFQQRCVDQYRHIVE